MSNRPSIDDDPSEVAPADLFEWIKNHPATCDCCFAIQSRRHALPDTPAVERANRLASYIDHDDDREQHYSTELLPDRVLREPDMDQHASPTSTVRFCDNCGHELSDTPENARPADELCRVAETLSDTLDEFGIEHDRDLLVTGAALRKEPSEWPIERHKDAHEAARSMTGRDADNLAMAVSSAVKRPRARRRTA